MIQTQINHSTNLDVKSTGHNMMTNAFNFFLFLVKWLCVYKKVEAFDKED